MHSRNATILVFINFPSRIDFGKRYHKDIYYAPEQNQALARSSPTIASSISSVVVAGMDALMGDRDKAFEWLQGQLLYATPLFDKTSGPHHQRREAQAHQGQQGSSRESASH